MPTTIPDAGSIQGFFTSHDALVAILAALFTVFLTQGLAWIVGVNQDHKTHRAWLKALTAESNYLKKCIAEAKAQVGATGIPYTKPMNTDLLKEARLVIFKLDEDTDFLECLTTAYGNVVLVNRMCELHIIRDTGKLDTFSLNVVAALKGTLESIYKLDAEINKKLGRPYVEPPLQLP